MDTIVQKTFVSPAKIDFTKLDEDAQQKQPQPQTITATEQLAEQLAEQTAQMVDDIRKYIHNFKSLQLFFLTLKNPFFSSTYTYCNITSSTTRR